MIYHKSKQVSFIEHGEANIDKIMHNGECVFNQGFDSDASDTSSVTLEGTIGKDLMDWSIVGNTVGALGVGDYDTSTGKYKISIVSKGKNLVSEIVKNETISATDGTFIPYAQSLRTDFIKVKENTSYTISARYYPFQNYVSFYDKDKKYISRTGGTNVTVPRTFTIPQGCVYIATNAFKAIDSQINPLSYNDFNFQVEEGLTATSYEPYYTPKTFNQYVLSPLMANETLRSNGTITRANGTIEFFETTPIGTLRNEEKIIKGTTTIITTDTEVLPTQIEASYKSNKADYVVVNFATADGNIFTTANGDIYTIKIRKSQYDTMMTNELLNLLEVM